MRLIGFASRESRGIRILDFKGSLDLEFAVKFGDELFNIINKHPEKDVVINLHEVDLIDSHCLSMLLSLRSKLEEKGKRVVICSSQRYIRKIMEIVDFSTQFEIYENEKHAIDALSMQMV